MKAKWLLALLAAALIGVGCQNPKRSAASDLVREVEELLREDDDTLTAAADTLLAEPWEEDEPLPATVDELFDDFVFVFDQNSPFQRQRTQFPLPIIEADGGSREQTAGEWSHRSLFLGQDFCTVLWNRRSQMELAQDSSVCGARVEQIYLHSRTIEAYDFERDSTTGRWALTEQFTIPFERTDLQDFLDFYRQFATDSLYQRAHVGETLHFKTTEENEELGTIEGTIEVDQWFEFAPELPKDVLVNIHYGQEYPNPNRMILQLRGINNGLQSLLIFHRNLKGSWRLTDFEN